MNKALSRYLLSLSPWVIIACSHNHQASTQDSPLPSAPSQSAGDHSTHQTPSDTPAAPSGNSNDEHNHSDDKATHHHTFLAVPPDQPAPEIDLQISEDAVQGWNLELQVTHFRFAPENVNQTSQFNEGHAHLYINGEKIGRLYSPWYHLPHLDPGEQTLMVTLNANGHEELQVNGVTIADSVTLMVPEHE